MRLIDADELEKLLKVAIGIQECAMKTLEMQNDEFAKGEIKAYKDILKGVEEMETVENAGNSTKA